MLDTNVLSAQRERRSPRLSAWIAGLTAEICLSAITVTELQFGASDVASRRAAFAAELLVWLEAVIATTRVIPLDLPAARLLGEMQAVRALAHLAIDPGKPVRFGSDLAIAATAIAAGAPLATLNLRHFRLIARHFPALVVVDPLGSR